MSNIPAVLLLHSDLSRTELGKILSLLGPLTVPLPWHMNPSEALLDAPPEDAVRVLRPQEDVKPPEDAFRRALAEYRAWARLHPDQSSRSFLKTGAAPHGEEDPLWDIRQRIRQHGPSRPPEGQDDTLRWHLVLHLARELESQREEADRILNALRRKKSPLEGLTDDLDENHGLFDDLPSFDWAPESSSSDPSPVLRAWIRLFGTRIDARSLLVTLDRRYVDHLAGLWMESSGSPFSPPPSLAFSYPDLSAHSVERIIELKKTHFTKKCPRELQDLLLSFGKDPAADSQALSSRAEALADFAPQDLSSGRIALQAVHLPPLPGAGVTPDADPLLEAFQDRTLIFLEDASPLPYTPA
jgi:hypothetical protein